MWRSASALLMALMLPGAVFAGEYGLGRPATPGEIAAWDIDVRPDGQGLPEGQGSVVQGETIFAEQCARCHGDFGEGIGNWPPLAGGDTLTAERPVKTVSSYWPYLSTVFDYTYRAMPFGNAQSLTPDEIYAVVAYILYLGEVLDDEEFVLSRSNFISVRLPNEDGFVDDPRPDTNDGEPCMKDCGTDVRITATALKEVTPDD